MSTSRLPRAALAGVFAAAALFAATACNSTTGYSASTIPAQQVPPGAVTPSPGGGLGTTENSTLGTVVTDASGLTLYRYDKDKNIPPTSNCANDCASTWPPVSAVSDTQVKGIDQNLIGSVKRSDGTKQLTIGGWPLYRYSGDKAAGDVNGQKKGGVWYVSAPDGTKAGESSTGTGTAGKAGARSGSGTTPQNNAVDTNTTANSDNSSYGRR
jgi:predicted lipoprotein with Yx(FWY)xxD motif